MTSSTITTREDDAEVAPVSPPLTMEAFLADIEKRAYHMAAYAAGSHADALDLLQDSMIKLVTSYSDRPPAEWKPLFYKILKNCIRDWHRRQKVKNLLFFWSNTRADEGYEEWPPTTAKSDDSENPEAEMARSQHQAAALKHMAQLSEKQRQCLLLRSWEGLSTAQTADVMGCSEGSVKTHYSRAIAKMRKLMEVDHEISF